MRLTTLLSGVVLAAASTVWAAAATAQAAPSDSAPIRLQTIPESFERAFYNESGNFYHNRSIFRQANYILGFGSFGRAGFPDLELERDAKLINTIYNDALYQQVASDPVIRTPDLPNPFNGSLRLSPTSRPFGSRLEGSEFIFETLPPR